ncbi:transmembrane 9 superfamily member 2-like isoform X2 [Clavelina lepadiformis]|uniref:transmembrane 9 superfamily member 2-like isoform X2 n=1 Tax=Clavelina lepadiformis TaxID=159417 RepID=UPI004041DA00
MSSIPVYVNRLVSSESIIPYEYTAFDFCEAASPSIALYKDLGQVLFGERIRSSSYLFTFKENETCKKVCEKKYDNETNALNFLKQSILHAYENRWIVDDMPMTRCFETSTESICSLGFPIGYFEEKNVFEISDEYSSRNNYFIFNHVDIKIYYHPGYNGSSKGSHLVRAVLEPKSFSETNCQGAPLAIPNNFNQPFIIDYTYTVQFIKKDDIEWASRWDYILHSTHNTNILWFSIMNSLIVMLFISVLVIVITVRIYKSNQMKYDDEYDDDVHDFHLPSKPMLLSVFTGVGTQVIATTFLTLLLASLGFISPTNRSEIGTFVLYCFVMSGSLAGYCSARLYKMFGGEKLKSNAAMTSLLIPGIIFLIVLTMDIIWRLERSSAALPCSAYIAISALYCGLMFFTCFGTAFGYKTKPIQLPVTTNLVPRNIVGRSTCCTKPLPCIVVGGILPFSSIFIQLYFILNSIWNNQLYNNFGFTFLAAVVLVILCGGIAIMMCCFQLALRDYHWWWRSFLTPGFTAVYFFIYAIHFYFTKLGVEGFASGMLYFGYTLIMTIMIFLFTGTVGFNASFWYFSSISSFNKQKSHILQRQSHKQPHDQTGKQLLLNAL